MSDDKVIAFPKPFAEVKLPDENRTFEHPTMGLRFMMEFQIALGAMKVGSAIARRAWVDTKMQYLFYMAGYEIRAADVGAAAPLRDLGENGVIRVKPSIELLTLFRHTETWSPTNDDLLAKDWYIFSTDQMLLEET